jgi:hypothetical protein
LAPAGITTLAGTCAAAVLLDLSATVAPPMLAAESMVTVPIIVPGPVMVDDASDSPEIVTPAMLRVAVAVVPP